MDEAFSYRTTRRLPRWEPWAVKLAIAGGIALLAMATFGRWVSDSENASFARMRADQGAAEQAAVRPPSGGAAAAAADAQAQVNAMTALEIAKRALSSSVTFADASPDALNAVQSELTFELSPSTSSQDVSIVATDSAWAAAVVSADGTCYYVRLAGAGRVTYGTGTECTGWAALGARGTSWDSSAGANPPGGLARVGAPD
jgi:hypothetical protein